MSAIAPYAARLSLDEAIEELGDLPVLDATILRVQRLSEDPDASTQDLVAALELDPSLASNVLRFANSSLSARPVRASSLHQAVTLVGRRGVGRLALEAAVCSFFDRAPGVGGAAHGQLHAHAVQVAACSAEVAGRVGLDVNLAHLAGLLHDLGRLVLPLMYEPVQLDDLVAPTRSGAERVRVEREHLGIDHAYAGARLAAAAGLDGVTLEAISNHHGTLDGGPGPHRLAACVQVGEGIASMLHGQPPDLQLLSAAAALLDTTIDALQDVAVAAFPTAATAAPGGGSLAREIARLEREARQDELTGLLNRRYWSSAAREQLARTEGEVAVLICDVDNFKRVNDFQGHQVGDFVLTEVGRILDAHGVAGRLGGDEFALFVGAAGGGEAAARLILDAIGAAFDDDELPVTISIGVAPRRDSGEELPDLLRRADAALYEAKRGGRGTFRVAEADG